MSDDGWSVCVHLWGSMLLPDMSSYPAHWTAYWCSVTTILRHVRSEGECLFIRRLDPIQLRTRNPNAAQGQRFGLRVLFSRKGAATDFLAPKPGQVALALTAPVGHRTPKVPLWMRQDALLWGPGPLGGQRERVLVSDPRQVARPDR